MGLANDPEIVRISLLSILKHEIYNNVCIHLQVGHGIFGHRVALGFSSKISSLGSREESPPKKGTSVPQRASGTHTGGGNGWGSGLRSGWT